MDHSYSGTRTEVESLTRKERTTSQPVVVDSEASTASIATEWNTASMLEDGEVIKDGDDILAAAPERKKQDLLPKLEEQSQAFIP